MSNPHDQSLSDDLLTGGKAIAAHLQWPVRKTFHALERGYLPATKIGSQWVALKSELRARFSAAYAAPK